jgi:spore coat protein U-like protein
MRRYVATTTTIAAGVLLALAGAAQAASKSDSFQVSAQVAKNCVINAPDLDLGIFDGTNNLLSSAAISIRCTAGTNYDVDLSTGSSGAYASRTLVNGADTLAYNLYTTNTYGTIWGDTTAGTGRPATGIGTGMALVNAQTLTVYGRLLAASNAGPVTAGTYTDTIVATITY